MEHTVQVTVEKLPKSMVKFTITTPVEEFEKFLDKTYNKLHSTVQVQGFRKGMAPKHLIMDSLGLKLYDEALNLLISTKTQEAADQEKIYPISYPEYHLESFDIEKPILFTATFAVIPEFTLGEIEKVTFDKKLVEEAKEGRKKLEEKQKEHDALVAKEAEEGKEHVHNHEEEEKGSVFNFDEYYSKMMDAVFEESPIDLPDALVNAELARQTETFKTRIESLGLKVDDFLKVQQTSLEQMQDKWKEDITFSLKQDMILEAYAKRENITVSEERLIDELKRAYKPEDMDKLDQYTKDYVKSAIVKQEAFKHLIDTIENNAINTNSN